MTSPDAESCDNANMTTNTLPPEVRADMDAVAAAVTAGRPVDPEVARRVRERADQARDRLLATHGVQNIGVQLIREARGPLTEAQEMELTLAQRDLLREGKLRLTDPDTGTVYVLVAEADYERLRGGNT